MADERIPLEGETGPTRRLRDAFDRPSPPEPVPAEEGAAVNQRHTKERATDTGVAAHYDDARDAVSEHLGERPPENR